MNAARISFGPSPITTHLAGPPLPLGKPELLPAPPLAHDALQDHAAVVKLPPGSGATRALVTVKDADGNAILEASVRDGEAFAWRGEAAEIEIVPANDEGEIAPVKAEQIPETTRDAKPPHAEPVAEPVIGEQP